MTQLKIVSFANSISTMTMMKVREIPAKVLLDSSGDPSEESKEMGYPKIVCSPRKFDLQEGPLTLRPYI